MSGWSSSHFVTSGQDTSDRVWPPCDGHRSNVALINRRRSTFWALRISAAALVAARSCFIERRVAIAYGQSCEPLKRNCSDGCTNRSRNRALVGLKWCAATLRTTPCRPITRVWRRSAITSQSSGTARYGVAAKRTGRSGTAWRGWRPPTALPRILHPWPSTRFAVNHPRWEPGAQIAPAGICAGGAR